jgi:hypothetical protein
MCQGEDNNMRYFVNIGTETSSNSRSLPTMEFKLMFPYIYYEENIEKYQGRRPEWILKIRFSAPFSFLLQ